MSMKKFLTITLALAMLTACSGGGAASGQAPAASAPESPASAQAPESSEKGDLPMTEITNPQLAPANGPTAVIKTNMGDITVQLYPEEASKAVENFITHAKNGYYDGIIFHRVINDFMIQGGDPTGTGRGGESIWGGSFEDEFSGKLHNFRGALSMANSGANTNGSQFFIVQTDAPITQDDAASVMLQWTVNRYQWDLNTAPADKAQALMDELNQKLTDYQKNGLPAELAADYQPAIDRYQQVGGTPHLDYKHTVFGQVIQGMEVVDAIAAAKTDPQNDKPLEDIKILSIQVNE